MTSLQLQLIVLISRQDVSQIPFKCSVESAQLLSPFKSYHKNSNDYFHVFLNFVPCPSHGGYFNFLDNMLGVFVLLNSPSCYPLWIVESLSKDVFELCILTGSGFFAFLGCGFV